MQLWPRLVLFLIVISIGAVCWWRYVFSRRRVRPLFYDHSIPARWGFVDVVMCFGLWFGVQILITLAATMAFGLQPDQLVKLGSEWLSLVSLASQLAQVAIVMGAIGFLVVRYQHRWNQFWYSWDNHDEQRIVELRRGAIAFAMWAPLVWGVQAVLLDWLQVEYKHPTVDAIRKNPQALVLIPSWISAVVCAPIIEEVLFRGVLQGWLQRLNVRPALGWDRLLLGDRPGTEAERDGARHFSWMAILVTSILFGGAHTNQGPAPITLFVFSLGLGYLYQRTGSLLACIAMHMLLNLVGMAFFTLEIFQ